MEQSDRAELIERIEMALWRLDGTTIKAVALITGMSEAGLIDLGGLEE